MTEPVTPRLFPHDKFELLVRSYLDNLVDWEVMHNFAIAHIDDNYLPEFQRPVEDLHFMFFPEVRNDADSEGDRGRIRFLLDLWELLKADVEQYGVDTVRERELQRMAAEDQKKLDSRSEYRERHRRG